MDNGGVLTLREPLSVEELQTGALVFLVDDGRGHIIEAVSVPSVVSGEMRSIDYYGDGILLLQQLSIDSAGLSYSVSLHDHSQGWRIVGARIDRQYWRGGSFALSSYVNALDGTSAVVGSPAMISLSISHAGSDVPPVALPLYAGQPITGVATTGSGGGGVPTIALSLDNQGELGRGNSFTESGVPSVDAFPIKAIIYAYGGYAQLRPLYPGVNQGYGLVLSDKVSRAPLYTEESTIIVQ